MTKRRFFKAVLSMITMAVLSLTVIFAKPVGVCSDEDGDDDRGIIAYSYDYGMDLGIAVNATEDGDDDRGIIAY